VLIIEQYSPPKTRRSTRVWQIEIIDYITLYIRSQTYFEMHKTRTYVYGYIIIYSIIYYNINIIIVVDFFPVRR
jgi:hypothetical protein